MSKEIISILSNGSYLWLKAVLMDAVMKEDHPWKI